MKTIATLTLILVALILAGHANALETSSPEARFDAIRKQYELPAIGVLASENGRSRSLVLGVRKYGELTKATVDDKWHLGSCTKAMTATLTAILVDRGVLRWNQTLWQSLSREVPNMKTEFRDVTIAQLAAHVSGLTGDLEKFEKGVLWTTLWDPQLDPVAGRKIVARSMLSIPPASAPGTKWEYSNANYMILAAIMESASKKTWESLIREELFLPLKMSSCGFRSQASPEQTIKPDQPWPHTVTAIGPAAVLPDFQSDNPPSLGPAGVVHCSLKDWETFAQLHLDAYNGKIPASLRVSNQAFAQLYKTPSGSFYTYGGWIRIPGLSWAGGETFMHEGSNSFNTAVIWMMPATKRAYLGVTNKNWPTIDLLDEPFVVVIHIDIEMSGEPLR